MPSRKAFHSESLGWWGFGAGTWQGGRCEAEEPKLKSSFRNGPVSVMERREKASEPRGSSGLWAASQGSLHRTKTLIDPNQSVGMGVGVGMSPIMKGATKWGWSQGLGHFATCIWRSGPSEGKGCPRHGDFLKGDHLSTAKPGNPPKAFPMEPSAWAKLPSPCWRGTKSWSSPQWQGMTPPSTWTMLNA